MEQDDVYDDKLDLSLLLPADFLSPQNTGEGFLGSTGSDDSLTLISNLDVSPERRIATFQVPESSSSTKSQVTLGNSNRNDYQSREDIFTEESFFMDAMADLNVADVLNDQEPVFSLNYDLRMEKDNFEEDDDADSQEEFYSAETTPVLKPVATPAGQLQQESMTIVDRFCLDSPNTSPTRLSPLKLITITPNAKLVDDSDLFMENPVSTPRASITDPDQRTSTVTSPTANNTSITSMISSPYSEQNNVMNSPLSDLGTPRRQELHEESKTPTAKPVKVETEKKPSLFRSMSRLRSPSKVKSVFRPVVTHNASTTFESTVTVDDITVKQEELPPKAAEVCLLKRSNTVKSRIPVMASKLPRQAPPETEDSTQHTEKKAGHSLLKRSATIAGKFAFARAFGKNKGP